MKPREKGEKEKERKRLRERGEEEKRVKEKDKEKRSLSLIWLLARRNLTSFANEISLFNTIKFCRFREKCKFFSSGRTGLYLGRCISKGDVPLRGTLRY